MREAKNIYARDTMIQSERKAHATRAQRRNENISWTVPNPQSPIPSPQSPVPSPYFYRRSNLGVEDRPCVTD